MFGGLRGRQREISGAGGTQKKSDGGKKRGEKRSFVSKKSTSSITNTKALSSGSSGSRSFTPLGRRTRAFGVDVEVERFDMIENYGRSVHVKLVTC